MTIFDELEAQYYEIDNEYSHIEFDARAKGWCKKEGKYHRKRELNDQAYFLFMFSRLENHIKTESSTLIRKKKTSIGSWKHRAAWDILPSSSEDGLQFKKRLALLVEQGRSDFNLIANYYKERNSIAHGESFINPISMPTVITEFKRLYKIIRAR
jgi:hypothetical protein